MTGHNLFDDVMKLLGYTDFEGNIQDTSGLKARALTVINRILGDIGSKTQISKLSDTLNLSKEQAEALPYGVAMLLSLSDGNGEKNRIFTAIYNSKRAVCKGAKSSVRDTLPVTYGA